MLSVCFARGRTGVLPKPIMSRINKLLKNAHLRCSPHPSPCQARDRLVAAYIVGNGLKPFPTRISGAPANGISQGSTCIWAFLISLKKMNPPGSLLRTPCLRRNASCRQANSSLRTCINNILYICLVVKGIVRVNFKSFIAL